MANIAIFRINYKSDFILTLNSDAGWMTPFCIKFWTGAPSQAYFVGYDGTTYTHCAPVAGNPTKLEVQFDDHHLPIGDLKFQIGYHFTVADFPTAVEDEVINQAAVIIDQDGTPMQVMLDLNGETAPEIQFSLPAYANEAQRIANEEQRIAAEQQRISHEESRIVAETIRQQNETQRINNEAQRIRNEEARIAEFAQIKAEAIEATDAANSAAALANEKAALAADKAALAGAAATLANAKAQLAADKAALADSAATIANDKAALAQQKAEYAQTQGGYAKAQGDYAKEQGDTALADHQRAEADHGIAVDDHTQAGNDHTRAESDHSTSAADHTTAGNDHTRAESDHGIAVEDHTQAGNDHTRAESDHGIAADDHTQAGNDHTRAESDHAAVEVYVDSLGVFDLSKHNAVGGVLATYADLSAALTALNALDSQYKYGGMSVKFVHSVDNNYVQARCMAQNFTTDVTQWQGVDDEPTAGSDNLVKSGGVFSQGITFNGGVIETTIQGYLKDDGSFDNSGNYKVTPYIKVTEGQLVKLTTTYLIGTKTCFGYSDTNGNNPVALISYMPSDTITNYPVIIPSGVSYIRLWGRKNADVIVNVKGMIDDLKRAKNAIVEPIDYSLIFPTTWPKVSSPLITANNFYGIKGMTVNQYIPSIKVKVRDGGENIEFKFKIAIIKIDGTSIETLYYGDGIVQTKGEGCAIFTPDIHFSDDLNGSNIVILPKERNMEFITYQSQSTDDVAIVLNSELANYTESSTFLPLIGFLEYEDNSYYRVKQKLNYIQMNQVSIGNIKSIIENGGTVYIEDGIYVIDTTINVPSNTHIIGGGNVVLKPASGCNCIFSIEQKINVVIEGIQFEDTASSLPVVQNIDSIKNKTGMGTKVAVSITGKYSSVIIDKCTFKYFNKAGLYLRTIESQISSNRDGVKVTNSFFKGCYIGIFDDFRFEYCNFSCISIDSCFIAIWCEGGNNIFTNVHGDTSNKVGFVLSGLENANEAHSSVVGCSFNHCINYSLVILSVRNGEVFDANSFFDADIYIENSKGLLITSNLIAPRTFEVVGGSSSGRCLIANNHFYTSYGYSAITNEDNVPLDIVNNMTV